VQRILENERLEKGEVNAERVSLIRRIMFMNTKDRMKLAMKGRSRSAQYSDPRFKQGGLLSRGQQSTITEQEIENIASMRTVSDEVLRIISMNRSWARSYRSFTTSHETQARPFPP
jgi:hypothetical protein